MTTPDVSVVIVNYNAGLELALRAAVDRRRSRRGGTGRPSSSTTPRLTAAPRRLPRFAPHARLLRNDQNVGFARGVNQGLAATSAPLVLIMNPDCRLVAGAFDALLRRARSIVVARHRRAPDSESGRFGAGQRARRPRHADRALRTNDASRAGCCRISPASKRNVVVDASGDGRAEHDRGLAVRRVHAGAPRRARAGQWIRRALLPVLGRRGPVPATARAGLPGAIRARRRPRFTASVIPAATARAAAIRAFHESAYLYYAIHVAPDALLQASSCPRTPETAVPRASRTVRPALKSVQSVTHLPPLASPPARRSPGTP